MKLSPEVLSPEGECRDLVCFVCWCLPALCTEPTERTQALVRSKASAKLANYFPTPEMLPLSARNPHCFQRMPFRPPHPLSPGHICALKRRRHDLCLFYSYPLPKAQAKSHLLQEALYDSPERHTQSPSEMPWQLLLSRGAWHSWP